MSADQIPAVGSKPDTHYKEGSWDVTPDTETAITSDTTYIYTYANDGPQPDKCTITFDANGGKGEMDAQEVEKNKATKLNKNEFTCEGYTFKEWNTEKDGSGDSFKDEASITPVGDMTLFAQWTNGDKEKVISDKTIKVELNEETRKILNDSLDSDLKKKVDEALAGGKEVDFVFKSKELGDDAPGADDISAYSKEKGYTLGEFFDLSLDVVIDGETAGSISNTSDKIRLYILIKDSLRKDGRLFHIMRFHADDVSEVGSGRGSRVPIKTDGFSTYAITYTDGAGKDHDSDDDDHEEHKPASWELNPNEKQQLSIVWKGTGTGVSAGYQEQGDIAKGVIKKAVPVGYKEAFSFDLLVNGKTDTSLKSGTMTLTIPAEYLKATVSAGQIGRQYAIIALDRYGKTYFLTDTDANPNTVTVNVNFEGFAMELIYTG